jgi:hypothetical protein
MMSKLKPKLKTPSSTDEFLNSITDPNFSIEQKEIPGSPHFNLCRQTAIWSLKKHGDIALWEYDGGSREKPDVLVFWGHTTTLYEIKMSRSDFKADGKKWARTKWKPKSRVDFQYIKKLGRNGHIFEKALEKWSSSRPELYYIEHPHLGMYRYYVCPSGLISPEEIPDGWGLYWVKNGRYYCKKKSGKFRRNLLQENLLLVSATRKAMVTGGKDRGIVYKDWEKGEILAGGEG